jgi:hypothetical protein
MVNSMAGRRAIFYIGLALYGVSFFLMAVTTLGAYGAPMRGYDCARFALGLPWGPNLFGHQGLFEDRPLDYLGVLLSGWINPTFLVAAFFVSFRPSARITRILAIATLAMIPFCWVVFYYHRFYPREGHFVWIAGMLLVLFDPPGRRWCVAARPFIATMREWP